VTGDGRQEKFEVRRNPLHLIFHYSLFIFFNTKITKLFSTESSEINSMVSLVVKKFAQSPICLFANFFYLCPFNFHTMNPRAITWSTPYTFSGKEKDAETGYGYFGARYYDSGLSMWLSVDPMSDKYPSMSPYNYCANNPVILVDPDGRAAVNVLIDPPYMRRVSECFGNEFSSPQINIWHSIPSVIPQNKFIGWKYNNIVNCYTLANLQLNNVGYQSTSKYYQAYTEQKGVNKSQTQKAISYITKSLLAGKPVLAGVDDATGHRNNDETTDHWIVIVGMGTDKKGNYFSFYDNATSDNGDGTSNQNKLYYDSKTGKITGTGDNDYSRNAERDYTITRVVETKAIQKTDNP
jgi:RHS repeat-associated protein